MSPVLLLAGCPFVFGPPDLSHVDLPTSATTGGTGSITSTPSETGVPQTEAPLILSASLSPAISAFTIDLVAIDPDGPLDGGQVVVTDPLGPVFTFDYPADVQVAADQFRVVIPGDPCVGWDLSYDVVVIDPSGTPSAVTTVASSGVGPGRVPEQTGKFDLGNLATPVAVCSGIEVPFEVDGFRFTAPASIALTMSLSWEGSGNLDLQLKLANDAGVLVTTGYSGGEPEVTSPFQLTAGQTYDLFVLHNGGASPGLYQLLLLGD
ncbi:MAG: hypothetical protein ABMB14_14910 [Myxococcota bacterium]